MELLNGKKTGGIVFTWIRLAALGLIFSIAIQVCRCELEPTESQCRPYIEKALKEQHSTDAERSDEEWKLLTDPGSKEENYPTDELTETIEDSMKEEDEESKEREESPADQEDDTGGDSEAKDDGTEEETDDDETKDRLESAEGEEKEQGKDEEGGEEEGEIKEEEEQSEGEEDTEESDKEEKEEVEEASEEETKDEKDEEQEDEGEDREDGEDGDKEETTVDAEEGSREEGEKEEREGEEEEDKETEDSRDEETESEAVKQDDEEEMNAEEAADEARETEESSGAGQSAEAAEKATEEADDEATDEAADEADEEKETDERIIEKAMEEMVESQIESTDKGKADEGTNEEEASEGETEEGATSQEGDESPESPEGNEQDTTPEEEDLTKEVVIPENLRPRDHITQILRLDEDSVQTESKLAKAVDSTLKSLKGLYDNAIKPLEMLYKYRDLSNRHFGDPEIFSKPLILFMGPWSGGKSTTINYLLDNEFTEMSLRTGAEPSPAYFNILMYGDEEEILDGTQLAADWTFSGLQKFGQGLLDRLKGYKLPNRLLEKVNIVEIPGILEIRKQVQRLFPFNDACQWFIDRADIIFLVYDPSKLDVGPETEAILDQLKGREYQSRIILNKADQVKPEELMRVQGTLIWNISPLMSSSEPPVMYTASLWSLPYESGAPTRLLLAQERAFLRDLRDAIDKRVENKIASARRFAVRVRNHAKMVDCYLTTYYNHKTFFGNKKKISDEIIENPQKYHIYEGLSTLTNISRYDLPDPDVYRDFFKLNPLYDFKKLSDTCTYFRGCPINTLDVAIAYDLPELVGKYKKAIESSKQTSEKTNS